MRIIGNEYGNVHIIIKNSYRTVRAYPCVSLVHAYKVVGFEVLTAVKLASVLFHVVTPCDLTDCYQCFGVIYCLQFQEAVRSSETLVNNLKAYSHNF